MADWCWAVGPEVERGSAGGLVETRRECVTADWCWVVGLEVERGWAAEPAASLRE